MRKTKYRLFDVNYMLGYVPRDLHSLNLPYHSEFTRENWSESANLMRKNHVNTTRFFLCTGEKKGDLDNFILPFKREPDGRFDLLQFGEGIEEIEWRLNEFWKRGIFTVLCIASGIKENRFAYTVWNGKNNINNTTSDFRYFMTHSHTISVYKKVIKMLRERWKGKPVIFELVNEPEAFNSIQLFNWHMKILDYCRRIGIPSRKLAFEKWDSSKVLEILKKYNCWMFVHAVNHINWFERFHLPGCEMQRYFFNVYKWVAADSDGAKKREGDLPLLGEGLVGKTWNSEFKRPAPKHMKDGLIFDYKHKGAGWIIMSAGAYYKSADGDKPIHKDWKHVAIDGLTEEECKNQNVKWELFSYRKLFKQRSLGELRAIRKAANRLFFL